MPRLTTLNFKLLATQWYIHVKQFGLKSSWRFHTQVNTLILYAMVVGCVHFIWPSRCITPPHNFFLKSDWCTFNVHQLASLTKYSKSKDAISGTYITSVGRWFRSTRFVSQLQWRQITWWWIGNAHIFFCHHCDHHGSLQVSCCSMFWLHILWWYCICIVYHAIIIMCLVTYWICAFI